MSDICTKLAILILTVTAAVACHPSTNCCCRDGGDLPEAKAKERTRISPEQQIITAHHEAAHAVFDVALLPKRGLSKLQVFSKVKDDQWNGLMTAGDGPMEGDEAYQHRALALISMAGAAIEEILFHQTPPDSDSDSDNSAFQTLAYCEADHCECPPESRVGDECLMNGLLKRERKRLYAEAMACAEANKMTIIKLAKLVILKDEDKSDFVRKLSQEELEAFFKANPIDVKACIAPSAPTESPPPASVPASVPEPPMPSAFEPVPPW